MEYVEWKRVEWMIRMKVLVYMWSIRVDVYVEWNVESSSEEVKRRTKGSGWSKWNMCVDVS